MHRLSQQLFTLGLTVSLAALTTACGSDAERDFVNSGPDGGTSADGGTSTSGDPAGFVYIETNNPAGNAVLAFARAEDGSLTPVPGGRYETGGPGLSAGPDQRLGPLDTDQPLRLSPDRKVLYAVNSGGDDIAVFRTGEDGALEAIDGSPFASGGPNPVSVGTMGDTLFVVNKAADGAMAPSYTALAVDDDGALSPIAGSTVAGPAGGSPSVAYVVPDKGLLFGTQFLDGARAMMAPAGQIDAFKIGDGGELTRAPGSPYPLPPDDTGMMPPPPPVALDMIAHPTENVLYVGFPTRSQLGVYTYDDDGALTFVRAAPNSGKAICWFLIDEDASHLYSVNSVSGTLSVYDLSDPMAPVETSALTLKQAMSGPPFVDGMGMTVPVTSQPFQLAWDQDQSHIYVLSQRATTNADDPTGNYLHTLAVGADGSLSEPDEPIDLRDLDVPPTARPQGIVVF